MEMLTVAEFSPSFSRMSAGTIDYALRHGAAKVDNFLSQESVESLLENGVTTIPSVMARRAPELQTYYDLLGIDDEQVDRISAARLAIAPNTGTIHIDSIPQGVSLLLPVIGGKAIFGANNKKFNPDKMPGFVVEYGVRDAIVLRQSLSAVNGVPVDYDAASHVGLCDVTREIVTIDFHTSGLTYDLPKSD